MSFWEHHLPWARIKILQNPLEIKGHEKDDSRGVVRERGCVCSRAVAGGFVHPARWRGTAAQTVLKLVGSGRSGKRSGAIVKRSMEGGNARPRVAATVNETHPIRARASASARKRG